jgi:hypothetical protein
MLRTSRLFLAALSAIALASVACSSSSAGAEVDSGPVLTDAPFDTGAWLGDGFVDTGADAACAVAVEGAPCGPGAQPCNQEPNPCCNGFISCDGSKWTRQSLGCACIQAETGVPPTDAPPAIDAGHFACGSAKTCNGTQFCAERAPGVDGGTSALYYTCESIPAACASTPTCDCVKANVGASCTVLSCKVDAAGNVTLGCMGA